VAKAKTWPIVVLWIAGIGIFLCAIVSLVMTTRTTGIDQWWWGFQAVVTLAAVSMLLTLFTRR